MFNCEASATATNYFNNVFFCDGPLIKIYLHSLLNYPFQGRICSFWKTIAATKSLSIMDRMKRLHQSLHRPLTPPPIQAYVLELAWVHGMFVAVYSFLMNLFFHWIWTWFVYRRHIWWLGKPLPGSTTGSIVGDYIAYVSKCPYTSKTFYPDSQRQFLFHYIEVGGLGSAFKYTCVFWQWSMDVRRYFFVDDIPPKKTPKSRISYGVWRFQWRGGYHLSSWC